MQCIWDRGAVLALQLKKKINHPTFFLKINGSHSQEPSTHSVVSYRRLPTRSSHRLLIYATSQKLEIGTKIVEMDPSI
jgi:hypothetical protein